MAETFDISEVLKNLEHLTDKQVEDSSAKAMNKVIMLVKREATKKCPVDDGPLRASITAKTTRRKSGVSGCVFTNMEYSPYVHNGTGIYAKDGSGRKTPWSYKHKNGRWIRTKGQKPNPFLDSAVTENLNEIRTLFVKEFKNGFK